ncbi:MAG: sulfatase-like hydrolase/transferase [Actinomycetota bacterium]|nr:sulfatase-like hydrolase/transferase [Actinomycetota bacterium]
MNRPNVFLLAIDSLRADAVFEERVRTPNFDAFVRTGAAFRQCICTTTTTTPSFSSILTGCYPPRHGVRGLQGHRLSSSVTTMAEAFSSGGYKTYAEVTGPLLPETGILRGFDVARHRQAYKVPFFNWRDEVIDKMLDYVDPWFMLLHIWEVHRPYRAPPDFEKRKDRAGYEAAVAATDDWLAPVFEAAGDNTIVIITGDHGEGYPESELGLKMVRWARKSRKVFKLNKWFGYLDNKLAEREIGHGFALYEHLVRVPLIIAGPGVPQAAIDEQVRHVDLFPTLADLCGVPVPTDIDGRSLRPLMEGGALTEEPAYLEAVGVKLGGNRIVGVRTPDWKLLRRGQAANPILYKLNGGDPPNEKRNLYRRFPEVARQLEAELERVAATESKSESGMTADEEATVEKHLRDLGYL